MGKTLKYVKEFDFGPEKTYVGGYCRGGPSKMTKMAKGGEVMSKAADTKQDKAMIRAAVHKHERAQHPGEPLTKLAKGGPAMRPMREEKVTREARVTPTMRSEAASRRAKVVAPPMMPQPQRGVPVAPTSPLLAMKQGGQAKIGRVMGEYKAGTLHSGKDGPVVKSPEQAIAIALSQSRKRRS